MTALLVALGDCGHLLTGGAQVRAADGRERNYDFVAWVYGRSSYPLPSPQRLRAIRPGPLPAGWRPEPAW